MSSALLLLLLPLLLATATATATTITTAASVSDDGSGGGLPAPSSSTVPPPPTATLPWPEQFHAVVITNLSAHGRGGGGLQRIDLYYDWPRGRDLNLVREQLAGDPARWTWNVEWTNGTAFLFDAASCATFQFAVGLLPPDWKKAAAYLGRDRVDGFECHVWSNFVFSRYYEDVATGRPVSWIYDGMQRHVLSFEAGAVLQDTTKWQAPAYCFTHPNGTSSANAAASSS